MWEDISKCKFPKPKLLPSLDELRKSEWCEEFEVLMRNRMLCGAFRYGIIAEQDYSKYDLIAEVHKRIDRYTNDKNLEHLVDAGNIVMIAFIVGQRNGHTLKSIDDGKHTPEIN